MLDDPLGLPVNGVENWQAGLSAADVSGHAISLDRLARAESAGPTSSDRPRSWRAERELLARLDQLHKRAAPRPADLDARIASYELAARMQLAATDALDISKESLATREMYGIGREPTDSYGRRCLIARRLVERGVRFVQLYINGQIWDTHTALATELKTRLRPHRPADCRPAARPEAARAVRQHAGRLGRRVRPAADRPVAPGQERTQGGPRPQQERLLHLDGGAGIKGGTTYGPTDELGRRPSRTA